MRDALREVLPVRFSLESMPNDTVEQVREKERAFAAMNARGSSLKTWRRIADLWCASWLATGHSVPAEAFGALSDAILTGGQRTPAAARGEVSARRGDVSQAHRFFHWELECPEVFFAADGTRLANGGFDAVLGNPPWDMIRADSLAHNAHATIRSRLSAFHARRRHLHRPVGRTCQLLSALRSNARVALTRAGGRVGLVLPAGLAIDSGSAAAAAVSADALRRRRAGRLRKPPRHLPDSPQHPVPAADGDCRPADSEHRVPLRHRRSGRARVGRRRTGGGSPVVQRAAAARRFIEQLSGDSLDDSVAARADRSRDRRTGRGVVSAARQRAGDGRPDSGAS